MKTGNVNQVAAFGKLVGICNNLGARYNPSMEALSPTALASLLEQAHHHLEAVNVARATYVLAVNARKESYAGIYSLASRISRAVAASEISGENINDVRLIKRKLLSKRPKSVTITNLELGSTIPVTRSSSRLDFESRAETFASLVQLLQNLPSYTPNEEDLKVTRLKEVLNDLHAKSEAVFAASNALANARINRNKVFLSKGGLLQTAAAVKEYLRSVFGVQSEVAKELGKLPLAA